MGSVVKISVTGGERSDLLYAEGSSKSEAIGKRVSRASEALFTVRYPNDFFLTLLNRDIS